MTDYDPTVIIEGQKTLNGNIYSRSILRRMAEQDESTLLHTCADGHLELHYKDPETPKED